MTFELAPERKKQILAERIASLNEEGFVAELNAKTLDVTGQDSSNAWQLVNQVTKALELHNQLLKEMSK
jgi:hypothetical protein